MKDAYEVLRLKEIEMSKLETEVEALRVVAPLLSSEGNEIDHDDKPTPAVSAGRVHPISVPPAAHANPEPQHSPEWKDRALAWP
jgi:hypothetical protein